MRTFNFKARNIGQEKYLTYTMGEECELDEDVLDYCEENNLKELVSIIYEEDDDYDYLTYDITDKLSLEEFAQQEVSCNQVLSVLRNVAVNLISLKEQAVHLGYILLNKKFMYVDKESLSIQFICLPIESKGSVIVEFKGFMRQLLANMKYNVEEDLNYVGKLLTYINGDNFNLRGLVGLSEALMEESGISFEETGDIEADGVEVVSAEEPEVKADEKVSDFMNNLSAEDQTLPEIGDDEEAEEEESTVADDEELESILPAGLKFAEKATEKAEETSAVENIPKIKEADELQKDEVKEENAHDTMASKETDVEVIKTRIKQLVGEVPSAKTNTSETQSIKTLDELDNILDNKPPVIKKNVVKVNRAALIQSAAAEYEETAELIGEQNATDNNDSSEETEEVANNEAGGTNEDATKSNSILSKIIPDVSALTAPASPPKAMPYLIRVNTEERIMLGKVTFKIGKAPRGVDYTVRGNGAISRQHAIIIQRDGVCYIKDNKSTNHTYVNGKMVEEGIEEILTHDSMIKLGDEEFLFKIR